MLTSERARELAMLSIASKKESKYRLIAERDALAALAHNGDPYPASRLSRVRAQLDRIDAMVINETDPKRLNDLACASMRLADQERKLAGRPDPGSYRPSPPKSKTQDQVKPVE